MGACRTSFVQTASKMVHVGQCRLISIHAVLTGANATTVKVFDTATSGGASAATSTAEPAGGAAAREPSPGSPGGDHRREHDRPA